MIVYGCCVGPSGKYESDLRPSLERVVPGARLITRHGQASIFEAYNSIMDEAATMREMAGLVLVHDDVVLRDRRTEQKIEAALRDGTVGVAGVVGGKGQRELSWWESSTLLGHVEHATHVDDFTRGPAEADVVDGLFVAVSPWVVRNVRLDGNGYPPFHGYDGELCSLVRSKGKKVEILDIDVFHDCKPGPWDRPEYSQALVEWRRRWTARTPLERVALGLKRDVLAAAARHPFLTRLAPTARWPRRVGGAVAVRRRGPGRP